MKNLFPRLTACLLLAYLGLALGPGSGSASITPPTVSNVEVSSITPYEAQLSGTVNPNGDRTVYNFEIRQPGAADPGWDAVYGDYLEGGPDPISLSASANLLTPSTEYQVRITASNGSGIEVLSPEITSFTTAPPPFLQIRTVTSKVGRKTVAVLARITASGSGTIVLEAVQLRGKRLLCRTSMTVDASRLGTVSCNLGRYGRESLRRGPLRMGIRVVYIADAGFAKIVERRLTIGRRR
jgi:hypothetical protein